MDIHATDFITYLTCARKFKYGIVDRLIAIDYEEPEYFTFGKAGHLWLKEMHNSWDVEKSLAQIVDPTMRDSHELFARLYKEQYEAKDRRRFQIASQENSNVFEFEGVRLHYTIDSLMLGVTNFLLGYGIMDHKFYASFPDSDMLKRDFQLSFYWWASQRLGLDIQWCILNVIRKSIPEMPMPLKSGGLTRAKKSLAETEYSLYMQSIQLLGLNPKDYSEELQYLKERGSNTFKRYIIRRSKEQIEEFEYILVQMIRDIKSRDYFIPSPSKECLFCPYEFLCHMQNTRGDVELAQRKLFRVKTSAER
jgi:hypothetical protein